MGGSQLKRELTAVTLSLLALFLVAAVATGGGFPESVSGCSSDTGPTGPVGSCLRATLLRAVGLPATLLLPMALMVHSLRLLGRLQSDTDRRWLAFLGGIAILLPIGFAVALGVGREVTATTGLFGSITGFYLLRAVGSWGAWIVLALAASALTMTTLALNPLRELLSSFDGERESAAAGAGAEGSDAEDAEAPARGRRKKGARTTAEMLEPSPEEMPALQHAAIADAPAEAQDSPSRNGRERKRKSDPAADRAAAIAAELESTALTLIGDEELPSPELLTPPHPRDSDQDERELDAMGVKLKEALRTFRVEAEIKDRTTGPVVTQFEVEPAPGVKVRQIANLANDLALAMRAPSIRIVAPIPGRGAVGVEVPNPTAQIVAFRELIESREFTSARMALPIALGKDLEGRPVIADLAKMPHLLIAGATGSGKSVCVNTIITSLVYRHTPRTLRFLMVDPKMVELSVYNVLPHLRHKVITDNRDAAAVLKWAVLEMQDRYELLAANGCRNIQDFNRRAQSGAALQTARRPDVAFEDRTYKGGVLPYIVVVIDELADLMMTVQGEVETPLAMLAQKARAIGVHLILATQRPSVNVITGLIKANFPSRIAFRVASQVDSRTILDGMGAEALLGNGDMLFIPPGKSEPSRLQGAYISSEDTERLTGWYESHREARRARFEAQGLIPEETLQEESDILEAIRQREAQEIGVAPPEGADAGDRDKLFREAAEVCIQHQQGSTSLLQRRLKVGYGRAARIIDQLHDAGVLGPPDGSKPRDVMMGLEDVDRLCGPRG